MSMHKIRKKNTPHHPPSGKGGSDREKPSSGKGLWLYGWHACMAAIANPNRHIHRLMVTKNSSSSLPRLPAQLQPEMVEAKQIELVLPPQATHQGIAMQVSPLPDGNLDDAMATGRPIVLLDHVTDPHNVGAILRSMAAFDAACLIVPRHGAPDETATMAKSACGALDIVPIIRMANLSQAMEVLKKNGYWCAGLDGNATQTIEQAKLGKKTALVMGAEGEGLRRLTAENCDFLVKLPISPKMESLNVSNAAAIALYELFRAQ